MPTAEEDYGLLSQHLLRFPDNPRGAPSTPGLAEAEEGFWSNEGACAPRQNQGALKGALLYPSFGPPPAFVCFWQRHREREEGGEQDATDVLLTLFAL